jgi:UDP-glucose 4-epimerase
MNILVTGGAGYIGSVVVEELIRRGHRVVVLDNLRQGHREAVLSGTELVEADLLDTQAIKRVFSRYEFEAVMHLAAETVVGYSTSDPQRFFQNNVVGGINLLEAMLNSHVNKIIFSSSAAVYGEHGGSPLEEEANKVPVNAYGDSKLIFEGILSRYEKAYGLKYVSLRYFNAAGATERLGEDHRPETHLIPAVIKAAMTGKAVSIYGADYPTADGTCVRDFVHVGDIGHAHVLALEKAEEFSGRAYNLGNQRGYSVLEVAAKAREITGVDMPFIFSNRRPGDPAVLVASSARARQDLGWVPALSGLDTIIGSTWDWMRKHPEGYGS